MGKQRLIPSKLRTNSDHGSARIPDETHIAIAQPEKAQVDGIPDFEWINRHIPIAEVAIALGLRLNEDGMIHCWHRDRHQHGDRTASVGVRKSNNTVKCFGNGCGIGPLGPIDLVRDVLALDAIAKAGQWIAERFSVPRLPKGKHLRDGLRPYRVGHGEPLEMLVKSGLWARLPPTSQRLAPILLYLATKDGYTVPTYTVTASYVLLGQHAGMSSATSIRAGLCGLAEIGWLKLPKRRPREGNEVVRDTNTYILTPYAEELVESANARAVQFRTEREAIRTVRLEQQQKRRKEKRSGGCT